ncbi:MAG TPA: DJ-1/PfpI family protein [Terriglobales bacterium]|nr:DJ-1/PfpI family protein [Terriglobales bacterium]
MWILSLPSSTSPIAPEPVPESETRESLSALRPRKRERPLIAVIGINDATETTDFLMPAGILRRADVAEVITVATNPGAVNLYPALKVQPDATVAEFDEKYGDGADYVIVPAMSRDDDPTALSWIKSQAAKGAIVIGVCAGAKVVGAAGLLDDKHATTHWYYLRELRRNNPKAVYVPNRRFVVDRNVVTTTGITASIPMSLTLIEAIAGRQRAQAVAQDLGVTHWDASHASGAFRLTRPFVLTVLENGFTFWNREGLEIELSPDIDEVSLVLVADAWSRTYRSRVVTFADTTAAVETRNGFRIIPDQVSSSQPTNRLPQDIGTQKPAEVLKEALAAIRDRYGERTSGIVAMQLEYPQQDAR